MTDYLDAHIRGRSGSAHSEASTTVASLPSTPLPFSKPPSSPLLSSQAAPKVLSNTILKSHGRPPWYYLDFDSEYREYLKPFAA
jgi:hypothetical protein